MNKSAPVYLNLLKIKLPLTGIISFLHRVTGVLLFFAIPLSIYALQASLQSEVSFNKLVAWLNSPLMIVIQVAVIAALFYHFFAGIRFLLMDLDIGYDKKMAERSSWLVLLASGLSSLIFIVIRFF